MTVNEANLEALNGDHLRLGVLPRLEKDIYESKIST